MVVVARDQPGRHDRCHSGVLKVGVVGAVVRVDVHLRREVLRCYEMSCGDCLMLYLKYTKISFNLLNFEFDWKL